jgi:hypothetical protein
MSEEREFDRWLTTRRDEMYGRDDVRWAREGWHARDATIADLTARNESLWQIVKDTVADMECLPGCDSLAHEELCPVTNPAAAWRQLREQVADLRAELEHLRMQEARAALG